MSRFWQPVDRVWQVERRTSMLDRKYRLYACGCCRTILHLLTDPRSTAAVHVAERFADGWATLEALQAAHEKAGSALRLLAVQEGATALTPRTGDRDLALDAARHVARAAWLACRPESLSSSEAGIAGHHVRSAWRLTDPHNPVVAGLDDLQLDIFGQGFETAKPDLAWLTWNDGTVPRLAYRIYEERRFEDLPILADALEEAGCTHASILDHCREARTHVRGCWVVDLLLGKE